jgi:hypothetical protein
MPSGSHGGSSGSHGGGGSRSGGGSSSFRGGSSGRSANRPIVLRLGRTRYVVPPRFASIISILTWVLLFMAFSLIACVCELNEQKQFIQLIEVDYRYYNQMILKAENFEEYRRIGQVTDHFYNEDCGKWYFTYRIAIEDNYGVVIEDEYLSGYTYSIFTFDEINKYQIGKDIQIAINTDTVKNTTDSIPILCKEFPIEADGEYIQAQSTCEFFVVIISVMVTACVGIIVSMVYIILKKNKKQILDKNGIYIDVSEKPHCEYCGGILKEEDTQCKSCGARVQLKEKTKKDH